jgi:acetyltransferase-like isoleucine patch superfamily enzyme
MMKKTVKKTFSALFIILCKLWGCDFNFNKTLIFLSKLSVKKTNRLNLNDASIEKSSIVVDGNYNQIVIQGFLSNTKIQIWGNNNQIIINPSVNFNNSTIVLRGNNCKIEIGFGSTFGSIYMVCMGENNSIKIGDNCMFAENIDLWATDSHPIYNNQNELVNPSKPIIIGDFVWVGSKSSILKGVTIGSGSIIGMSSIVTKDIAPATLNVGNPLRCIKTNIRWEREFIKL